AGHSATLFMALLAAYSAVLSRYSGAERLVVGTPVAGRRRWEVERLIGFFVNTLPVSVDLTGAPTFAELLLRVRDSSLEAFAHGDVPFEKMVEELRPERSLSHSPLFQVMLAFQSEPRRRVEMPGLHLSLLPVNVGTAKFDLTLFALAVDGEMRLSL